MCVLYVLYQAAASLLFVSAIATSDTDNTSAQNMSALPKTMRAVGLYKYLPISDVNSLLDVEVKLPEMRKKDVLVIVKAVGVNPIDTKLRAPKPNVETTPRILGWDGSGVVVATGKEVKLHKVGDEVFFAGDLARNGANAEYYAVHEYFVGKKPKKLTFEEAAAMPITTLTAYETMFDRMRLSEKDRGKTVLVINSAGGVGSIATQLAKNLGLYVIGTASREATKEWSKKYGADTVLNHTQDMLSQLKEIGHENVDYILVNFDPYPYWDFLMKAIKPQGLIALIVDSSSLVDIRPLKDKSITLVSVMMQTRVKYDTEDRYRHNEILEEVSKMFDEGKLRTTLSETMVPMNAENMRKAHRLMEEKKMIGKLVVTVL